MSNTPQRDTFYFFEQVFFKVEETLFCVPKHGLNVPGTPFEAIFSLPTGITEIASSSPVVVSGDGQEEEKVPSHREVGEAATVQHGAVEGLDEAHPIMLESISAESFRQFLRVLYPFPGSGGPPSTRDDWEGVLDLATMWEFHDIRNQAIDDLTPILDDVESAYGVLLGKKYRVKKWLDSGYHRMVAQPSVDHRWLLEVGLEYQTVCNVLSVRENVASVRLGEVRATEVVILAAVKDGKERDCSRCKTRGNCPYRQTSPEDFGKYVCRKCGVDLKAREDGRRKADIAAAVNKAFAEELASL